MSYHFRHLSQCKGGFGMQLTVEKTIAWMERMHEIVSEHKEHLTNLDQVIGDGDHGINMARGFQEVVKKLSATSYATVADVLRDVAMTIMSKVGGASGPLYGTAFLKMSTALKGKEVVTFTDFAGAVTEALNGLIQRGKANPGDKTMVDVWDPVSQYIKGLETTDWDGIVQTAREAMEKTKDLQALKGRAAYLKERSIGHIDPGATSSYYLFLSLADVMKEGE